MNDIKPILKANNSYKFKTDALSFSTIEVKGIKKHFVTGYISTPDIDLYDDLVTPAGLKSMLKQIESGNITLDYEHEAWRDDNTILPVGKIVEAKIDDRGLWVKAEINKHSPKFKNLWGSIKDGFVNAFSIAFKPISTVMKTIGDAEIRLIDDLVLMNVALTGAPVNPEASMTGFSFKSAMANALKDMDTIEGGKDTETVVVPKALLKELSEDKMTEKVLKDEAQPEAAPVEEAKPEEVAPLEEAAPTEAAPVEEAAPEEAKPEEAKPEVESKAISDLTAQVKSLQAEIKSLKDKAVFKSVAEEAPVKEEVKAEENPDIIGSL